MGQFLYYSAQTHLAYFICKEYFGGKFYVHCAEEFAPQTNPGSSSPASLYEHFKDIAEKDDHGDPQVWRIKQRLKTVALEKRDAKELTASEFRALTWDIENAAPRQFAPILYLIPKSVIKSRQLERLPQEFCANPHSIEYTIKDLIETQFEALISRMTLTDLL